MQEPSVVSLIGRLTADPIRDNVPFSPDIAEANDRLFAAKSDREASEHLQAWLHDNQPCLFGRMAAGAPELFSFCILTERDLAGPDSAIRQKIQDARLQWRRDAHIGQKSGFVILAFSRRIALSAPDEHLQRLAVRLAELYLLERIEPNRVYHDRVTLEIATDHYRDWVVGANFFAAQGDGRWWHDHRMPGGIALSMNSIGHMVKSGEEHNTRAKQLAAAAGEVRKKKPIDSLYVGLRYAMLTINRAHCGVSGKATCLRSFGVGSDIRAEECPLSPIPAELRGKDWRTYLGWYDTDITIPTAYFRVDIERPPELPELELDFTYLFDDENTDYYRTGPGVRTK